MARTLWIALALVVTAGLLWFVSSVKLGSSDQPTPAASAEPPELDEPALDQPVAGEALAPTPPAAPAAPTAEQPSTATPQPSAAAATPTSPLPPPEKTGPVDELAARFASESRDASASAPEKTIETAFISNDVPKALLHSVQCRRTVCRVETRWAPDRAIGFLSAFTRLLMIAPGSTVPRAFDSNLGITPSGPVDADGVRSIDVYIARLPPPVAAP